MSTIRTFSLQSGSNGNSIFVEADGVMLLFDAGISGVRAEARMAEHGYDIRDVDALIISHDHRDHIACAGVYHRKFGIPLYITRLTLGSARRWMHLGRLKETRFFRSGDALEFGPVVVRTLPTPHDAVDGVAFLVECAGRRLGIMTDLGHPFPELTRALDSVDAAYLESNYDPARLAAGTYPPALKRRIRGPAGHLSNFESAELVRRASGRRMKWVATAHLSGENNDPALARAAHQDAVGAGFPIYLASRDGCSVLMEL